MQDPPKTQRLGRSALLVQGLALLAMGIAAAGYCWKAAARVEGDVVLGMSLSAAAVLILWSLILSLRAIAVREASRWAWVVFSLALIELSLPCLWLWTQTNNRDAKPAIDLMMWLGLPVFGPFIAFGTIFSMPIAMWRSRKDAQRPLRTWAKWYAGIMVVVAVLLVPAPLFLLGATTIRFYRVKEKTIFPNTWIAKLAPYTPNFIRDTIEEQLVGDDAQRSYDWLELIYAVGNVSADRLQTRFCGADDSFDLPIWHGLTTVYPEKALDTSLQLLTGKKKIQIRSHKDALNFIAERGNAEQLALLLEHDRNWNTENAQDLAIDRLVDGFPAKGLLPVLQKMVLEGNLTESRRETVLNLMDKMLTPRVMIARLISKDIGTRRVTSVLMLSKPDDAVAVRVPESEDHVRLMRCLFGRLADSDEFVRLSAMCALGRIFRERSDTGVRAHAVNRIFGSFAPSRTINILPEDLVEIEKLRVAVLNWFNEHKLSIAEP